MFSVNEALDSGSLRKNQCVEIEGILSFEQENISLNHWPKIERREGSASSIWIDPDGVFAFNDPVLQKWSGKRVVVLGIYEMSGVYNVDGWYGDFGHFQLWQARIRARRIDLLKERNKSHST